MYPCVQYGSVLVVGMIRDAPPALDAQCSNYAPMLMLATYLAAQGVRPLFFRSTSDGPVTFEFFLDPTAVLPTIMTIEGIDQVDVLRIEFLATPYGFKYVAPENFVLHPDIIFPSEVRKCVLYSAVWSTHTCFIAAR